MLDALGFLLRSVYSFTSKWYLGSELSSAVAVWEEVLAGRCAPYDREENSHRLTAQANYTKTRVLGSVLYSSEGGFMRMIMEGFSTGIEG